VTPGILKYGTRLRYVVGLKSPPPNSTRQGYSYQLNTMLVGFRVGLDVVVKVKVVTPTRHTGGVEV
jgi:hypothetical protein